MTALRGIANGWGYDIAGADVLGAYAAVMAAASAVGQDEHLVKSYVRSLVAESRRGGEFIRQMLARQSAL